MTTQLYKELNDKLDFIINNSLNNKKALSMSEASDYIGITKTYLYQLTHRNLIPFYKPNGKQIYFDRNELDNWLLSKPQKNAKQLAKEYTQNNFRGVK